MDNEKVTDIKTGKIVGVLELDKDQLKFIDEAFSQIGSKRETAQAFAGLCNQLDKLKAE